MLEKIDWYKEILELEPNSKLFFPLARLLVENNDSSQAIEILEKGLDRHPDFMEARLFLIELMYKNGLDEACSQQVQKLSRLFSHYAGFWQAWAACLSATPGDADTASIVRFLAAHFLVGPLQINEVLNLGLAEIVKKHQDGQRDSLIADSAAPSTSSDGESQRESSSVTDSPAEGQLPVNEPDLNAISPEKEEKEAVLEEVSPDSVGVAVNLETFQPVSLEDSDNLESALNGTMEETPSISPERPHAAVPETEAGRTDEDLIMASSLDTSSSDEGFSLRTRSMAEVLADQGDYQGAIDIYRELALSERNPDEAQKIRARMEDLESLIKAKTMSQVDPVSAASPAQKKERLLGMLEALAKRVEARMHG